MCLMLLACGQQKQNPNETPWGEPLDENADSTSGHLTLADIQKGGEMIMLTVSGPDTYYDYHGKGMGAQYLVCEKLAEHLNVTLRVDICRDTTEMLRRLKAGEGDIIAVPLDTSSHSKDFLPCGTSHGNPKAWVVKKESKELADAINAWYKPTMLADVKKQEKQILTEKTVIRHVYPSLLSAEKGTISNYDHIFKKYAGTAGVDWTLLAAQCYQESCFDPRAQSFAGACGLMQIMPSTADHLGLSRSQIYEPEPNVAAAAKLMRELQQSFSDIPGGMERLKFALAAYNAGAGHIRDAISLAKKDGAQWQRWDDIRSYVRGLATPEYYSDPVVKHGYMRGSETAGYVDGIMARWSGYHRSLGMGAINTSSAGAPISSGSIIDAQPHRAAKKNKWR